MLSWLLPKEIGFFDFFEKHAALIVKGAEELVLLLDNPNEAERLCKSIQDIEHEADHITHQCVESLHKTFITPIEREDIFKLISKMDDILDFIHATADRLVIYRLESSSGARQLADTLLQSTQEIEKAVRGLRNLKEINLIRISCIKVHQLENEADTILRHLLGQLFDEEKNAIQIIKWKEIYDNLETATDCCEDVANIIEGVTLEHSG